MIEQILETDQRRRRELSQLDENLQRDEKSALWAEQHEIDRQNQLILAEIIRIHGWPTQNLFGKKAVLAAFLVVQHASLPFQTKYLPLLKSAAEQGEVPKAQLAFLIDRIRLLQQKPQLYGSQLKPNKQTGRLELYPLEDATNVDVRRTEMGLEPLAAYLELFGLEGRLEKG